MDKPQLEVADIFRQYGHQFGNLSQQKRKIVNNILKCRTEALGGHIYRCDDKECSYEQPRYNSCNDRMCPKCQYRAKTEWVENRVKELLPVSYFHIVFTLPHEFNELILTNKKEIYNLLFKSSSEAIKKLFKTEYGGQPGIISILHTWGQNLSLHPHVHMVLPQGGLSLDKENQKWVYCHEGYYLSVEALSDVFRAIFIKGLKKLFNKDKLTFLDVNGYLANPATFQDMIDKSCEKDWVVYSKKPFAEPIHVLKYLGNYTHRIAFSNFRLVKIENGKVFFSYKDYNDDSKKKLMTLGAQEFMRRFLMHVVPKGFIRIRYYGIFSHSVREENIQKSRELLEKDETLKKICIEQILKDFQESRIYQHDNKCPKCKKGTMEAVAEIEKTEVYFDTS